MLKSLFSLFSQYNHAGKVKLSFKDRLKKANAYQNQVFPSCFYDALTCELMDRPVAMGPTPDQIVDLASIRDGCNPFSRQPFSFFSCDFDSKVASDEIRKLKFELELKIAAAKCYGFDIKNEHGDIKKTRDALREKEHLLQRYLIQKEIEICMERFVSRQEKIADLRTQCQQLQKTLHAISIDEHDLKVALQQSLIEQQRELQNQLVHEMFLLMEETKQTIMNEVLSAGKLQKEISAEIAEILAYQEKELSKLLDKIRSSHQESLKDTVFSEQHLSMNSLF